MTGADLEESMKKVGDKSKDIVLSTILQFFIVTLFLSKILNEDAIKSPFRKGIGIMSAQNSRILITVLLLLGLAWVIKNHRQAEAAVGNN